MEKSKVSDIDKDGNVPRAAVSNQTHQTQGHPPGLKTLFLTECWERFSFYGLRPLLVLFMSAALHEGGFGFERSQASAIVGIYAASVYLSSLPGGWIADRLLGLRRAILCGALLIASGHLSIGCSNLVGGKLTFFLGLVLIVIGTGFLKPNISAMVGELYPEGGARRDAGFSIFYMGINSGAFVGQLVTGFLGEIVGWHWGFAAAGVGMLIGLMVFATRARRTLGTIGERVTKDLDPIVQRRQERRVKLAIGLGVALLASVFALAATGVITLDPEFIGQSMTYVLVGLAIFFFGTIFVAGKLNREEKQRVAIIGLLFVFAAIFWSAFEQAPTSLNLFAKDFTNRSFAGFEVPAVWFQSINSAFIILLAPLFAILWTRLGRTRWNLSSPMKFSLGLIFAGLGFLVLIFAANLVVTSGGAIKVSFMWLVGSYFLQTIGELCLSPVGLSSMTKLSPRRYVGQMMGVWFLAASLGNLISGLVGGRIDPNKLEEMPRLFTATTISLLASGIALGLLSIPIRRIIRALEEQDGNSIESRAVGSAVSANATPPEIVVA